jgi:hypothetical protein
VEQTDMGEYVYVDESEDGQAFVTQELLGKVSPISKGMKKGAKTVNGCHKQICGGTPDDFDGLAKGGSKRRTQEKQTRRAAKTTGTLKNLVVLVYFNDHEAKERTVPSQSDIDVLMNADEPDPKLCPTGSLKGVYREISYGQLAIESTVTPWIPLSKPEAWYADGRSG